jgi:hypothetical protein
MPKEKTTTRKTKSTARDGKKKKGKSAIASRRVPRQD